LVTFVSNMSSSSHDTSAKLGFIEEIDSRLLNSHFFPSKVGGRPAWLSLNPIPDSVDLQCSECKENTCFLMQVYSPLQIRDDCFHRTLFVFICKNPSCSSSENVTKSFKVFRSQLPVSNDFYSAAPPDEDITEDFDIDNFPHAGNFSSLCLVCGIKGSKKCSQCKKANYCGKNHQVIDWKAFHKEECKKAKDANTSNSNNKTFSLSLRSDPLPEVYEKEVFEEFDLVTEEEVLPQETDTNNSKTNEESLKEFEDLVETSDSQENKAFNLAELEESAKGETEDDKEFLEFQERIRSEPTQVLRYNRNSSPLWVSAYQQPQESDIPDCKCGAKRVFEFQIMPQILIHLKLDKLESSVDWGTLCVYTCADSCKINNNYSPEFIWKQDFHNSSI